MLFSKVGINWVTAMDVFNLNSKIYCSIQKMILYGNCQSRIQNSLSKFNTLKQIVPECLYTAIKLNIFNSAKNINIIIYYKFKLTKVD